MKRRKWSYGYKGVQETRSVLITQLTAASLGLKAGTVIHFSGPPVREVKDMSPEEVTELEAEYDCRVDVGRFQWGLT